MISTGIIIRIKKHNGASREVHPPVVHLNMGDYVHVKEKRRSVYSEN